MKNEEDNELIRKVLLNDVNSQNKLYDKYKEYITNFLKKHYTQYNDIEDDVSEIIIKIFSNLNSFDDKKSKFTSWVCNVAKNHMVDKWRSSDITNTIEINDGYITSQTNYYNADISTDSGLIYCRLYVDNKFETTNALSHVTSQLSTSDCTLLTMKYIHGYSYCEISDEMNISSTSASNRVNYIKGVLKKNNPDMVLK
ncbi:MAG: sigma-70 family RNA polymerase sigma factor [bacterium]